MSKRWARVTKEPIHPYTKFRVPDLLEGCQYEFRVAAENEIGIGDPSPPSKPVFAKDPIGTILNIHSFFMLSNFVCSCVLTPFCFIFLLLHS